MRQPKNISEQLLCKTTVMIHIRFLKYEPDAKCQSADNGYEMKEIKKKL